MRNDWRLLLAVCCALAILAKVSPASAAFSLDDCRAGYRALKTSLHLDMRVDPIGPEELLLPVRRWLTTQVSNLAGIRMTQNVGDVVSVAGTKVEILEKLGHGAEGDVYLVKTENGLQTLKTFFQPARMEINLKRLTADFPMAAPEIIKADPRTGRVLMEYIEGASVDHITDRWREMGLTASQKEQIMNAWDIEQLRIQSSGHYPPAGYNVIYSFRTQKFCRVDPI